MIQIMKNYLENQLAFSAVCGRISVLFCLLGFLTSVVAFILNVLLFLKDQLSPKTPARFKELWKNAIYMVQFPFKLN